MWRRATSMELPGEPCPDAPPSSLLDLPASWLRQMLGALDPPTRLQLFMACRATRDLVLQRPVRLRFALAHPEEPHLPSLKTQHPPTLNTPPNAGQASLQLACRHSASVQLVLSGNRLLRGKDGSGAVAALLSGAMHASGNPLTAITSLQLPGLKLDALVPSWLTTTCPRITCLKLHCEPITLRGEEGPDGSTNIIPDCTQLKELHLYNPPPSASQATRAAQWRLHLGALKGLTSLHLTDVNPHSSFLQECCSAVGTHLTHLTLPGHTTLDMRQFPVWWPGLVELSAPGLQVDDQALEGLLGLPMLRVIRCKGFQLQQCYIDRQCSWSLLSVRELDVDSFDRLPLGGVQRVEVVAGFCCEIIPSTDVRVATRVVRALAKCGGVRFVGEGVWGYAGGMRFEAPRWVRVDNSTSGAGSACLAAIMPLLSACPRNTPITFSQCSVTPELAAAMGHYLSSTPHDAIGLSECTFSPDVWPVLLPSLPSSCNQLSIAWVELSEAEITEMCVHACRPLRLSVEVTRDPLTGLIASELTGWEGRVQAAMAAAGHQHVTLTDPYA